MGANLKHLYQGCPCTICYPGWPDSCDRCHVQLNRQYWYQAPLMISVMLVFCITMPLLPAEKFPELSFVSLCLGLCMLAFVIYGAMDRRRRHREAGTEWSRLPKKLPPIEKLPLL